MYGSTPAVRRHWRALLADGCCCGTSYSSSQSENNYDNLHKGDDDDDDGNSANSGNSGGNHYRGEREQGSSRLHRGGGNGMAPSLIHSGSTSTSLTSWDQGEGGRGSEHSGGFAPTVAGSMVDRNDSTTSSAATANTTGNLNAVRTFFFDLLGGGGGHQASAHNGRQRYDKAGGSIDDSSGEHSSWDVFGNDRGGGDGGAGGGEGLRRDSYLDLSDHGTPTGVYNADEGPFGPPSLSRNLLTNT